MNIIRNVGILAATISKNVASPIERIRLALPVQYGCDQIVGDGPGTERFLIHRRGYISIQNEGTLFSTRARNTVGPTIFERLISSQGDKSSEKKNDIVDEIKELIEEKIRPIVQEDGGDLEFVSYENHIVRVRLQGACTSCPSSSITLKNGVKNMLQYHIPEVLDVEQVFDEEE